LMKSSSTIPGASGQVLGCHGRNVGGVAADEASFTIAPVIERTPREATVASYLTIL
jgi:hypothetical protein